MKSDKPSSSAMKKELFVKGKEIKLRGGKCIFVRALGAGSALVLENGYGGKVSVVSAEELLKDNG